MPTCAKVIEKSQFKNQKWNINNNLKHLQKRQQRIIQKWITALGNMKTTRQWEWKGILLTPAMGAVLMSASTVIVVINARLLRIKDEPKPKPASNK